MSVRSFHSVFMASVVAGAALGCYLVSLRVASERAALNQVETEIALAQRDIRLLQTEIGTRARLSQLERWNVRVLALSAPTADQILGDKFQLARMISPERKPVLEAPVVLASAPAAQQQQPQQPQQRPLEIAGAGQPKAAAPAGQLLHQASLKLPQPKAVEVKPASPAPAKSKDWTKVVPAKPATADKKAGEKGAKTAVASVTKPAATAKVDPLAPLPAGSATAKGSRANR